MAAETDFFPLWVASLDADSALEEASKRAELTRLNLDACVQERIIQKRLADLSEEQRVPETFDPEVYDALSPREIGLIVTRT